MFGMFMILFMLQGDSLGNSSVKMGGFSMLNSNWKDGRDVSGVKLLRRSRILNDQYSQLPLLSTPLENSTKSLKVVDSKVKNIFNNKKTKSMSQKYTTNNYTMIGKVDFDTNTF